jgi:MFS family permease
MGIGIGLTISPATTDALGAATARERSQASGIVQTVRQIGGVIGIAVLGAIAANVTAGSHTDPVTAATDGVAAAFWTGAAMAVIMSLAAASLLRRRTA